jgi:lysophospholipase L1-like esterase
MLIIVAVVIGGAWSVAKRSLERGKNLNKTAWEASYTERKQPVPESGPREGYWGSRVGIGEPDTLLVWRDSEVHISGLIEVGRDGLQRYQSAVQGKRKRRIVILGASTASGAYASSIRTTYFNIIGKRLEELGMPSDIDVFAAGAWKSSQEIKALERYLQSARPDVVVFLDGLNDMTNGATSRLLFGEPYKTANGVAVDSLYHSHDYAQRAADYLQNMALARELTAARNIDMLVVLQPSLNERTRRTPIEDKLLAASLVPHASSQALTTSYDAIRNSLTLLSKVKNAPFFDCSKVFDAEKETVFADIWHFSDFGHQILGKVVADKIAGILQEKSGAGRQAARGAADNRRSR